MQRCSEYDGECDNPVDVWRRQEIWKECGFNFWKHFKFFLFSTVQCSGVIDLTSISYCDYCTKNVNKMKIYGNRGQFCVGRVFDMKLVRMNGGFGNTQTVSLEKSTQVYF